MLAHDPHQASYVGHTSPHRQLHTSPSPTSPYPFPYRIADPNPEPCRGNKHHTVLGRRVTCPCIRALGTRAPMGLETGTFLGNENADRSRVHNDLGQHHGPVTVSEAVCDRDLDRKRGAGVQKRWVREPRCPVSERDFYTVAPQATKAPKSHSRSVHRYLPRRSSAIGIGPARS